MIKDIYKQYVTFQKNNGRKPNVFICSHHEFVLLRTHLDQVHEPLILGTLIIIDPHCKEAHFE